MDRQDTSSIRRRPIMLVAFAIVVVLSTMSIGIVFSRDQSKHQIVTNLKARSTTSAEFVATFLAQQATRQTQTAERFLASPKASSSHFKLIITSLGSDTAVLLDRFGRLLEVAPSNPAILGSDIAPRYSHLTAAEAGRAAVSGVVPSASEGKPVVAVAVPYPTPQGRRVLSVAYPVAGSVLSILVEHTISYKQHHVMLLDASGKLIAASPSTSSPSLSAADPVLAKAVLHASQGEVTIAGTPSTFVVAHVSGTSWRLVIAVPDYKLFASISGWQQRLPWIVFVLVAILALIVLVLFIRSHAERVRLTTLSAELDQAARTDMVTTLANRRSLQERLAQASAYANRYGEVLSALVIDLDHFKQVNDSYGHETGDEVLCAVADCMREVFRDSDIFGRWGGDEFLAVLPATNSEGARGAGQRLCESVAAIDFTRYGLAEQITLSVGCASAIGAAPNDLVNQADNSLFSAKRAGRSRVIVGG
jgi:diguanylate cyclase (GGDEF)-like protein